MDILLSKSLIIFIGVLLILVLATMFPSPLTISSLILVGCTICLSDSYRIKNDKKE